MMHLGEYIETCKLSYEPQHGATREDRLSKDDQLAVHGHQRDSHARNMDAQSWGLLEKGT